MTAKSMCNSFGSKRALSLAAAFVFSSIAMQGSFALPIDGVVVRGDAIIENSSENTLTITQESDRAVINFEDFSIGDNEQVVFIQPGAGSSVLNRVVGNNLSEIYGDITANGQVFLINTKGIIFGEGANIHVGGLVASTFDLSDDAFMTGQLAFNVNANSGAIINSGNIRSHGNSGLAFIAPVVMNNGVIEAVGGDVHISSEKMALQKSAVFVQHEGSPIHHMIEVGVDDGVIENNGIIRATEIEADGGDVVLLGGSRSDIYNSGSIDVSSYAEENSAGEVFIEANRIAQLGEVSANGFETGDGGNIHAHAYSTLAIGESSLSQANAGYHGNGGNIIYFSPDTTLFRSGGFIEAMGGSQSGNGGFVDVSGLAHVEAFGLVNTSAAFGQAGEYLIDPYDIVISTTADTQGGWTSPFMPTSSGANINVTTLETNLQLGSVTINTANGAGTDTGNISILNNIDLDGTNGNSLSLIADGSISLAAGVTLSDSNAGTADVVALNFIAGGNVDMQDTSLIDAGEGTIAITAGGNVNVGGLRSNSVSANAIAVSAGAGIFSVGSNYLDADAPVGGLSLTSVQTNALNTNVNALSVTSLNGDFSITNGQSLSISNLSVQGNVNLTTTSGDLTLTQSIDTDGANGSTWNFNSAGNLTVNTGISIEDSNTATADDVNFLFNAVNQFDARDIARLNAGSGTIQVSAGGNVRVTNFITSNNTLSAVQLAGANILGDGSQATDVSALNGGVVINTGGRVTGEIGSYFEINTQVIDATMTGSGDFIIDVDNDITLTGSGFNLMDIRTLGALTIDDAGLQSVGNVTISATDIRDSDNSISLTALQAFLDISAPTQDLVINTDVDTLDVNIAGSASVSINEANDIVLLDLNADTQSLAVNNGNIFLVANGDVSVSNNINAQDLTADGLRSGMVSLESLTGNISVGTTSTVSITSNNTLDQFVAGGVGNGIDGNASQSGIYLGLQNNTAATRTITLGSDTSAANILAIGGDVEIDAVGDGTNNVNAATINFSPASSISAYNDIGDPLDGSIFLDGNAVSTEANISVRANRSVALTGVDYTAPTPTIAPTPTSTPVPTATPSFGDVSSDDVVAAANDGQDSVNDSAASSPDAEPTQHADDAFEFVFGASQCDDLSEENKSQCTIEASIKAFLSHWMVGGQLPPQKVGM